MRDREPHYGISSLNFTQQAWNVLLLGQRAHQEVAQRFGSQGPGAPQPAVGLRGGFGWVRPPELKATCRPGLGTLRPRLRRRPSAMAAAAFLLGSPQREQPPWRSSSCHEFWCPMDSCAFVRRSSRKPTDVFVRKPFLREQALTVRSVFGSNSHLGNGVTREPGQWRLKGTSILS